MPYYKGSWYSQLPFAGFLDPEDRPGSAAYQVGGRPIPDSQQGIALPTRGGLGKWYNVTQPGGDQPFPLQQTDIGPAKRTGRGVDISAAGAHQMGYTPKNFPTDAQFKVEPIDLTGLGLAAGYGGGIPGDNTAIASGPSVPERREPQGPKMPAQPASLMDMLTGKSPMEFTPQNAMGEPTDFGNALQARSNSLIGLGLGLLSPRQAGESAWNTALRGYMGGAAQDNAQAYRQAQLQHQKSQEARQAAQDKIAQQNWERQFARSDPAAAPTEFTKAARDLGLTPGTPEHTQFAKQFYQSRGEGDWQIVQAPHPIYPGETVPVWANKRTRETVPFTPGSAAPDAATAGAAAQGGAQAPANGIKPAPPGSDPKEWRKEQTKLLVQQQIAEEARKKAGASIDPVTEDIDRALNQTKQYPGMIAGTFGNLMKNVPGSQAADVAKLVDTIKANASLDKLQAMRASSPTGASGLGAVTQGEHKLLQDSIGALDQAQTPEQFLYNLDRVKRIRHEIVHGPGTAPPPQFELPASQRPQGGKAPKVKPGAVEDGFVFKGGDPGDQKNWAPVR